MSIVALPNGKFRVQVRRKGFPKFDKVFPNRSAAEGAEAKVKGEHKPVDQAANLTLSDVWERYSQSQSFLQKAEKTQNTEASRIKPVLAELGEYSLLNLQNSTSLVYDYIDKRSTTISSRTKKKLSSTSVRLEVAALSAAVAFAKQRKIVQANFIRQIDRPAQAKRKRRVPGIEVAGLRSVTRGDDPRLSEAARFALILRFLGCRPGELAGLKRADLNLHRSELTFRNTKYKAEDRLIHLVRDAVSLFNSQIRYYKTAGIESEFVFSTLSRAESEGKKVYVRYNYTSGVNALRKLGVIEKSYHSQAMRREFISRAIETGLEYSTIRKQTGHHSTQAIEIYDEGLSTADEIRQVLDKHASVITDDELYGTMQRLGASREQIEAVKKAAKGERTSAVTVPLLDA
ncbi:tyrosine-type recombinase/integrase [Duganella sp. FT135W]|uniref:Tyrosine-type recombinase/integrase n=1 Tax=Duganella flavida TaxID=2692175 RepID=A0A6L8KBP1_9BURK|nr:site-specific integrase [Duganella flavida]MYM23272.1 tyrosine-type recombinase/integrase [Duganella flavida]